MKKILLGIFLFLLLAFALPTPLFVVPKNWPTPQYDFSKNKLRASTIYLGRVLFYDTELSKNNSISCASCHSPYSAFAHSDHALSHGIFDSIGTRNAPALQNLAWQSSFMWDGAIHHLDVQALAPLSHPGEMASSISELVKKLRSKKNYHRLFFKAYGDSLITGEKTLKALSQFMLGLVSSNATYDRVMRKEMSFTEQQKKGYVLFKQHCATCHPEPLFSTYGYANNGLAMDSVLRDTGRNRITHVGSDSLLFKIPSLRNCEYSFPYMHDGRFRSLSEVLTHYTKGIQKSSTLDARLKNGINLSSTEKVDVIAFLLTLSDKEFIFNKSYAFPREAFAQ